MHIVFKAHQGLGLYLLTILVIAEAVRLIWAQSQPPEDRPVRWLPSAVIGLVDLQVLLGFVLFFGGWAGPGFPMTHLVLGLVAAIALHVSKRLEGRSRITVYLVGALSVLGGVYLVI